MRPSKQLVEEGHAIGVGPVQIVDDEDHLVRCQRGEQLPQGGQASTPQQDGVAGGCRKQRIMGRRIDLREHREHLRQRRQLSRQHGIALFDRKTVQVLPEAVDDPVECLVGHRLPLITATSQNDDIRLLFKELAVQAHSSRYLRVRGSGRKPRCRIERARTPA